MHRVIAQYRALGWTETQQEAAVRYKILHTCSYFIYRASLCYLTDIVCHVALLLHCVHVFGPLTGYSLYVKEADRK